MPFIDKCVACGGIGRNSRGGPCLPCQANKPLDVRYSSTIRACQLVNEKAEPVLTVPAKKRVKI